MSVRQRKLTNKMAVMSVDLAYQSYADIGIEGT